MVHKKWEPIDSGQLAETALSSKQPTGYQSDADDIVIGCSVGHPALMIYNMTQELVQIAAWITECKLMIWLNYYIALEGHEGHELFFFFFQPALIVLVHWQAN